MTKEIRQDQLAPRVSVSEITSFNNQFDVQSVNPLPKSDRIILHEIFRKRLEGVISRILYPKRAMIIYLEHRSPGASCNLPGNFGRAAHSYIINIAVFPYLVLLRVGFAMPFVSPRKR